jgi:hypothetical protein
VAFLYTNNKQVEEEIRETTPCTIATNNIEYLGVTLTKQMKDLYDKNFKYLKKEIGENLRRWKDLTCSWIGRINTVKMIWSWFFLSFMCFANCILGILSFWANIRLSVSAYHG